MPNFDFSSMFGNIPPFDFQARMIYTQAHSIQVKMKKDSVDVYKIVNRKINKIRKHNYDENITYRWLENSWNTERVLRFNNNLFQEYNSAFALQWSFPQAYYSVFCSLNGLFKTIGRTPNTHAGIIKEANNMIQQGYYPIEMSFLANGGKNSIHYLNIEKPSRRFETAAYDESNQESVNNQICQFLKSTREIKLDDRKQSLITERHPKILNMNGKPYGAFRKKHWDFVSDQIGATSIFDLLYRKRIKSNYKNVNVFQSDSLRAREINDSLVHIVSYINYVHEYMLFHALGKNALVKLYDRFLKSGKPDFLCNRKIHMNL